MTLSSSPEKCHLTASMVTEYHQNGFLILPARIGDARLTTLQHRAYHELEHPQPPWELESELGYPGAPDKEDHTGSKTIRRLQEAYTRHALWQEWATDPTIVLPIKQLLDTDDVYLSQNHHNCLMTKSPRFSSDTGWHQDIRYWSFHDPELITAWLALGKETSTMGGIHVIPGSHRLLFDQDQFNTALFFIDDSQKNTPLISTARAIELNPGDVLLFDSRLLHRASRNYTHHVKLSLVFTYRRESNNPTPGSRSAQLPDIAL